MHPLERLVNLVALLLESRRPLTFEQIRAKMPEGYGQDDLQSAKRMFERDKDVLRDVGVPIEVVATDAWEVEHGYAILKDRYYLPEIDFTPEEISAMFVAAHAGERTMPPSRPSASCCTAPTAGWWPARPRRRSPLRRERWTPG